MRIHDICGRGDVQVPRLNVGGGSIGPECTIGQIDRATRINVSRAIHRRGSTHAGTGRNMDRKEQKRLDSQKHGREGMQHLEASGAEIERNRRNLKQKRGAHTPICLQIQTTLPLSVSVSRSLTGDMQAIALISKRRYGAPSCNDFFNYNLLKRESQAQIRLWPR